MTIILTRQIIELDIDDLVKSERGTREGMVTVRRGGKVFRRKQRLGQKDKESSIAKWIVENIEPIKTDNKALVDEFDRIKLTENAKEYFDSLINYPENTVRGSLVYYLDDDSKHKLVDDEDVHVRFTVGYYSNNRETIKQLLKDKSGIVSSIAKNRYYAILSKHLSEKFLNGEDITFDDEMENVIKTISYEDKDDVKALHKGLNSLYSVDEKMNRFNMYSKEEWLESSNNAYSGALKYFMTKVHDGTKIRHHDSIDLKDDETIDKYFSKVFAELDKEGIINYIKLQQKLTKKLLDIRFPDQDEFTVYRGTTKNEISGIDVKVGDEAEIEQNPISSWTLRKETAEDFAKSENGVVIKMAISKDDIWSSFLTHSYSALEQEMIVIGKEGSKAEIVAFGKPR